MPDRSNPLPGLSPGRRAPGGVARAGVVAAAIVCLSAGCAARRDSHTVVWSPVNGGEALVFSPFALETDAPAPERSRRDASLSVGTASQGGARWFPAWAGAAQAPALRPWPPYGDLRGQREWEHFWRHTPRSRR